MSTQNQIDPSWWDGNHHNGVPMRQVLADRDIKSVFGFLHSRGWSWAAIARATDLGDQRVREIASGKRRVENYDVFVRISTGLGIPKPYLGLGLQASEPILDATAPAPSTAHPEGKVIDLDVRIDIEIGSNGAAKVSYRYEILNLTDKPLTRLPRELWFQYTDGALEITPLPDSTRRVVIDRIHDTPNLSKFSCQLSPAIRPGESAVVGHVCTGGKFVDALYWRQSIRRHTSRFTIALLQRDVADLAGCTALEEQPNGSEHSVTEDLVWDNEGGGITITLTRENLRPDQSVTVRWELAQ